MRQFLYRLMYLFGKPRWDSGITPPEVTQAFDKGDIPPGAVLDLGCGTGTNVIYMAQRGRQAIGIDFVPEAISQARQKVDKGGLAHLVTLYTGDVTHLERFDLPAIGFALDMGCFHGIDGEGRQRYLQGLAKAMSPGGWFMLYTLDPRQEMGVGFGLSPQQVRADCGPYFEILREERGSFSARASTWYWMLRRAS